MKLYRAVSEEELADILATGVFHSPAGALETKWFAESLEHAMEWGRQFGRSDGKIYKVVEIEIVFEVPDAQRRSRLDGIGAACWLSLEQLRGVAIREVST